MQNNRLKHGFHCKESAFSKKNRYMKNYLILLIMLVAATGCATLHDHVKEGDLTKVKAELSKKDANVNAKDRDGNTPLHIAIEQRQYDNLAIIKMLIAKGANVNIINKHGDTPLHVIASKRDDDYHEKLKLILSKKAKTNIQNADGHTPLHLALMSHNYSRKAINLLIAKNSPINARDNNGNTPLHIAVKYMLHGPMKLLVSKGAKLNIQNNEGYTPLDLVSDPIFFTANSEEAKYLISKGAVHGPNIKHKIWERDEYQRQQDARADEYRRRDARAREEERRSLKRLMGRVDANIAQARREEARNKSEENRREKAKGGSCVSGNCINGTGTYYYPNGSTYAGQFSGGYKHGNGVLSWPNGDKFSGSFISDTRYEGYYYWANGVYCRQRSGECIPGTEARVSGSVPRGRGSNLCKAACATGQLSCIVRSKAWKNIDINVKCYRQAQACLQNCDNCGRYECGESGNGGSYIGGSDGGGSDGGGTDDEGSGESGSIGGS
ncbi:MAG: ankyrin repeat domain-containing protein [Spirochaetes bacterium]|nr:ankyrin repeat domain-containing protein [Spirochaetota bacterium]